MNLIEAIYRPLVLNRWRDDPGAFDPSAVEKILVVRNDNIGDVICTTPALDALRRAFPRARIDALVCTLTEQAISGHRALDRLYVYPKAKHRQAGPLESWLRLARALKDIRSQNYDLVVSFRVDFSTSQGWLAYASRGRWRLGAAARGKRRRWGFFYNLPVDKPPKGLHEVERCFHLLRHIQVDSPDKRLYLEVPPAARLRAEDFLRAQGLDPARPPLVVNITRWAYRPDRRWPEERYRGLVAALLERGQPLVVTCAPADKAWVSQVLEGLSPAPALFCSPSLKEFAAMLGLARLVVTAEGGPMHLAAAVGAPLVALWGGNAPEVWRPWGVAHTIVGGLGPVAKVSLEQMLQAVLDMSR